jgi:Reverse transcriptase (RNA-dependent DNA polymerase)
VISPLLANLFLHYAFDMWMTRNYPHIPFERYADDAICHCQSAEEARVLWSALADRLAVCKLVLHPGKTKIVYCILAPAPFSKLWQDWQGFVATSPFFTSAWAKRFSIGGTDGAGAPFPAAAVSCAAGSG